MESIGYPDLEDHKVTHRQLLGQVHALRDEVANGDQEIMDRFMFFLETWLVGHIVSLPSARRRAVDSARVGNALRLRPSHDPLDGSPPSVLTRPHSPRVIPSTTVECPTPGTSYTAEPDAPATQTVYFGFIPTEPTSFYEWINDDAFLDYMDLSGDSSVTF